MLSMNSRCARSRPFEDWRAVSARFQAHMAIAIPMEGRAAHHACVAPATKARTMADHIATQRCSRTTPPMKWIDTSRVQPHLAHRHGRDDFERNRRVARLSDGSDGKDYLRAPRRRLFSFDCRRLCALRLGLLMLKVPLP